MSRFLDFFFPKKRPVSPSLPPPQRHRPSTVGGPRCPNEAKTWISTNRNLFPFAANRFSRDEAIDAVNRLYRAGASCVMVAKVREEPWRLAKEGGPYADTLVVKVPPKAKSIVTSAVEGLKPDESSWHKGGGVLRLWWD